MKDKKNSLPPPWVWKPQGGNSKQTFFFLGWPEWMYTINAHKPKKNYFISYLDNLAQEIRRHFNFIDWCTCQNHNHILGKIQKLQVAILLKTWLYKFLRNDTQKLAYSRCKRYMYHQMLKGLNIEHKFWFYLCLYINHCTVSLNNLEKTIICAIYNDEYCPF